MNMETMKINLAKQLFGVEEKAVLDEIKSILDEKVIVAYAVDGKPLTLSQYNAALEKAEEDVRQGRVHDSDSIRKEMQEWKK